VTAVKFGVDSLCHYCKGMGITRNATHCLHCSGTGFDPGQKAAARRSDPETSHEAAQSVTSVRFQQGLILQALRMHGPMHDQAIYELDWIAEAMSPSGARTRRSELVGMGKVEATAQRVTLRSGRSAIVWKAR
jgi:hypothetical protein